MFRSFIKKILKKFYLYKFFKNIYKSFHKQHPLQKNILVNGFDIVYCGSDYGGWSFVNEKYLDDCIIISAGLGEDASFDIEFATKYNAKIIIVDPTPRAVEHYKKIIQNIGKPSTKKYSDSGNQPISAYDLSDLGINNFTLIEKALWNKNEVLRFYQPNNPNFVSHSIIDLQNNLKKNSGFINVPAITIKSLLEDLNLSYEDIPLIKLDIEGAQIEVIKEFLDNGFKPRQILVEFDELNFPSKTGFDRVSVVNQKLIENNYKLIKTDERSNFLYYKN